MGTFKPFSVLVKPFDISSYTGRSRKKSKDDFSSMEKVKQIVLFVKRQTHERRHLGFVGNLTEETFFYVIYTLRLICTQITIL